MLQVLVVKARPLRGVWPRVLLVALAAAWGAGLAFNQIRPAARARSLSALLPAGRPGAPRVEASDSDRDCLALHAAVGARPRLALPPIDQPELRFQLLGRTKNVPLLFLSRPDAAADSAVAAALRQLLESSPGYATFDTVVGKVRATPELAQAVFLREGYLYTENPELAALYGSLTLSLLFRDPELQIVRGVEQLSARRLADGDYDTRAGRRTRTSCKAAAVRPHRQGGDELQRRAPRRSTRLSEALGFDELSVTAMTPANWRCTPATVT